MLVKGKRCGDIQHSANSEAGTVGKRQNRGVVEEKKILGLRKQQIINSDDLQCFRSLRALNQIEKLHSHCMAKIISQASYRFINDIVGGCQLFLLLPQSLKSGCRRDVILVFFIRKGNPGAVSTKIMASVSAHK